LSSEELRPDKYNKFFVNGESKPIYVGDKSITYNYEILYIPIREMLSGLPATTMTILNQSQWISWSLVWELFSGTSMMDATTLPIGNLYRQLMYILEGIDRELALSCRSSN
jgi:hypothetical protein